MQVRLLLCFWLAWLGSGNMAGAAGTTAATSEAAAVVVDGETLFQVRRLKSIPARLRADKIAERIRQLAEDPFLNIDDITLAGDELSTDVVAGETIILSVLEPDAAKEGVSRQERAAYLADKIRAAIGEYRKAHSVRNLLQGLLFAIIATLMLGLFIYALFRLFLTIERKLDTVVSSRLAAMHIRVFEYMIKGVLVGAVKLSQLVVTATSLYLYFSYILSLFPWTRKFAGRLFDYILETVKQIGLNIWDEFPNLTFLLITFLIVRYLIGLLRLFFAAVEKGDIQLAGFYPEWAAPSYKIGRFLVIIFAVVIAYPYIPGSGSRAFQGISIFFGVLFSLGSTSLVANMLAGVVLTYMRGFRVGDVVKIGDTTGKVIEVTLLVTRLRTPKNVEITIPNSILMGSQVTNYSFAAAEKRLILPTSVTIGYDAPWRQVHGLLLMAAERTGQVLREPAPFVLQNALDDFYVKYELNVYAASSDDMPRLYSELHQNIQDAFNEYGVQIMSPHYVADPESAKIVPRDRWSQPPARTGDSR